MRRPSTTNGGDVARQEDAGAPKRKRSRERLVGVVVLGAIALNYPILFLFSQPVLVFGIPLLYLYLFGAWIVVIVLTARVLSTASSPSPRAAARGEKD